MELHASSVEVKLAVCKEHLVEADEGQYRVLSSADRADTKLKCPKPHEAAPS